MKVTSGPSSGSNLECFCVNSPTGATMVRLIAWSALSYIPVVAGIAWVAFAVAVGREYKES